jgi:transketolase
MKNSELEQIAKSVRKELFVFKSRTGVGHPASSLSLVDIIVSLYHDDATAFDHTKDVLIFSKAHGSPAVYPILANLGYYPKDELEKYALPEGILRVHADQSIPGCHFVGGSLGNGIGYAAGLAMGKPDTNVYVILGDGELYEGSVWESLMFIAHNKLRNMTLIVDRNKLTTLGATEELLAIEPLADKFKAFGMETHIVDGHSFDALRAVFNKNTEMPRVIIANTVKGKGVSYMEGVWKYHVIVPTDEESVSIALKELS